MQKNESTLRPSPVVFSSAAVMLKSLWVAVFMLGLLAFANSALAANWYVRPSATGSANGTDWNNAWTVSTINWASVNGGDTIWLAGGTHPGVMHPTKGGSAGNYLYIKRVRSTDAAPTAAAGWNSSFDSQAIISNGGTALWFDTLNISYIYFDGRLDMGLQLVCGNASGNQASCNITRAAHHLTFTNIDFVGPGSSANGVSTGNNPVTMNGDHTGIRSFAYFNSQFETIEYLTVTHCRVRGHVNEFWWHHTANSVVEYCKIYDNAARNSAEWHGNMFINAGTRYITFRYNEVFNWQVEGIFCIFDSCSYWYIYGNLWHDGMGGANGNTHRVMEPQSNQHGPMFFYNNTVVNCWSDIRPESGGTGSWSSGSQGRNNIYYNISSGYASGLPSNANDIKGGPNPFVNYAGQDYRIVATVGSGYPRNAGAALTAVSGQTFNLDSDGKTRGADGSWDIGAFEYGSAVASTNPVISVTPASQDLGSVQAGTSIDRTFTVQNLGAGTLTGTASVSSPFSIVSGGTYSLGSNQTQTVTVRYSPTAAGNHNQTVTFTGGGGASVAVSGAAWVVQTGLSFGAEAGTITAPFTISTAGYISQSSETGVTAGGRAVYGFTALTAGNYKITVNVNAPSDAANSVFVNVDAEPTDPTMIWDIPLTTGFTDRVVAWRGTGTVTNSEFSPKIFPLTAGTHQLIVRGREGGVQLDQISIKKALAAPPNLTAR